MDLSQSESQRESLVPRKRQRDEGESDIFGLGPKKRPYVPLITMLEKWADAINLLEHGQIHLFITGVTLDALYGPFVVYNPLSHSAYLSTFRLNLGT
jgi:hypothetical protein